MPKKIATAPRVKIWINQKLKNADGLHPVKLSVYYKDVRKYYTLDEILISPKEYKAIYVDKRDRLPDDIQELKDDINGKEALYKRIAKKNYTV